MKSIARIGLLAAALLLALAASQVVMAAPAMPSNSTPLSFGPPLAPNPAPNAQGCSGTPSIQYAYANPPTIYAGQTTTLYWGLVANANAAYLQFPNGHRQGIGTPGSQQVNPTETKTYLVVGTCGSNTAQIPVTVTVNTSPGCSGTPQITSFTGNPTTIQAGQQSTLAWGPVNNANYVQLSSQNQGGSGVPAPSSVQVSPNTTTTYYLTAWCQNNSVQAQVTINVTNPPPPPPSNSNRITGISYNSSLSNNQTLIMTVNYYWNGQDAPAVLQGTAYNASDALVSTSNATRINANQNFYANLNFRINPTQVTRINACIIGNSGTELVCQSGSK